MRVSSPNSLFVFGPQCLLSFYPSFVQVDRSPREGYSPCCLLVFIDVIIRLVYGPFSVFLVSPSSVDPERDPPFSWTFLGPRSAPPRVLTPHVGLGNGKISCAGGATDDTSTGGRSAGTEVRYLRPWTVARVGDLPPVLSLLTVFGLHFD